MILNPLVKTENLSQITKYNNPSAEVEFVLLNIQSLVPAYLNCQLADPSKGLVVPVVQFIFIKTSYA